MASKTATDIEELRNLILALDTKIEKRFDQQEKRIDELETTIKVGFTEVKGEIKRLDERINSVEQRFSERINSVEQRIDDTRSTLEKQINDTRSTLEREINNTRSTLESQITITNARLNTITIGFFGIVGILVTGILTVLGKLVFFPNNLS